MNNPLLFPIDNALATEFLGDWLHVMEPFTKTDAPSQERRKRFVEEYHWHVTKRLDDDMSFTPKTESQKRKLTDTTNRLHRYAMSLASLHKRKAIPSAKSKPTSSKKSVVKMNNSVLKSRWEKRLETIGQSLRTCRSKLKEIKKIFSKEPTRQTLTLHLATVDEITTELCDNGFKTIDGLLEVARHQVVAQSANTLTTSHLKKIFGSLLYSLVIKLWGMAQLYHFKQQEAEDLNAARWNIFELASLIDENATDEDWEHVFTDAKDFVQLSFELVDDQGTVSTSHTFDNIKFQLLNAFSEYSIMDDFDNIRRFKKQMDLFLNNEYEELGKSYNDIFSLGFEPDQWQSELIQTVDQGKSVLVSAPTSTGKTFIAFYLIEKVLRESDDGVLVFVCPTKALVNQVYAEVYAKFNKTYTYDGTALLGMFTADDKIHVMNSQVLICVPESLEILMLSAYNQKWKQRIRYCVFDEVHFISENTTWEHLLSLIRCPFLALSATVGNPKEFVQWLNTNKNSIRDNRTVELIQHKRRPRDLAYGIYKNNTVQDIHPFALLAYNPNWKDVIHNTPALSPKHILLLFETMQELVNDDEFIEKFNPVHFFTGKGAITRVECQDFSELIKAKLVEESATHDRRIRKIFDMLNSYTVNFHEKDTCLQEPDAFEEEEETDKTRYWRQFRNLISHLNINKRLPAIVFNFSRSRCNAMLHKLRRIDLFSNTVEKLKAQSAFEEVKEGLQDKVDFDIVLAIKYGIAVHHSGMNKEYLKEVERLFRSRVLKVIIATGTLSHGIHMPCRTVVIAGWNVFMDVLTFNQCCGRAGRRGFDTRGDVVLFEVAPKEIVATMTAPVPNISAKFMMSVSFVLRMLVLVDGCKDNGKKIKHELTAEQRTKLVVEDLMRLLALPLFTMDTSMDHTTEMRHYFRFAIEYLMREGYINQFGVPQGFTGLITHIFFEEPSNFLLVHYLQNKLLHKLLANQDIADSLRMKQFVSILCHLFTRHNNLYREPKLLPSLSSDFLDSAQAFNQDIHETYEVYKAARKHAKLPRTYFNAPKYEIKDSPSHILDYFLHGDLDRISRECKIIHNDIEVAVLSFHKILRKIRTALVLYCDSENDVVINALNHVIDVFNQRLYGHGFDSRANRRHKYRPR
jgi:ERCC4-related helicase